MNSLRDNAKILNISTSYLCDILNGKKGCNEKTMNEILKIYPKLNFKIFNPRYRVLKNNGGNENEQKR